MREGETAEAGADLCLAVVGTTVPARVMAIRLKSDDACVTAVRAQVCDDAADRHAQDSPPLTAMCLALLPLCT
jgi:hypothetical protein